MRSRQRYSTMSWVSSTIHGRNVCKDRERTISIFAIQSKKSCVRKILKAIVRYRWWGSYWRWKSYKSIDIVCDTTEAVNYPTEFLSSLDLPGKPPHNLQLNVGSPVILLHNLNPPRLWNGTRLVIKKWMKNVIEAILNDKF
jgi:hypothetical protein